MDHQLILTGVTYMRLQKRQYALAYVEMDTFGLSHLMAILGSGSGGMPMEF